MSSNRCIKENRGSASIEASISLVMFIFFVVTIYSVINVCRAQALVQTAIDEAAKEISQYSYLYKLTGLQKQEQALNEKAEDTTVKLDAVISSADELYNAMSKGLNVTAGDMKSLTDDTTLLQDRIAAINEATATAGSINSQIGDFSDKFENLFSDPKGLMIGFAAIVGQKTLEEAKSHIIAAPLAKTLAKKNFELPGISADNRLKGLGIENGLDGLDFSLSTIFPNGKPDINITVGYKVKIVHLLPIKSEAVFCQTASTRGWLYGDGQPK